MDKIYYCRDLSPDIHDLSLCCNTCHEDYELGYEPLREYTDKHGREWEVCHVIKEEEMDTHIDADD